MLAIPERSPTETILIEPNRRKSQPLLTYIHGGPHSLSPTAFSPAIAAYALQGCTYPHLPSESQKVDVVKIQSPSTCLTIRDRPDLEISMCMRWLENVVR